MLRTLYGGRNAPIIDSTMALYCGRVKYPKNEYKAVTHALKLIAKENIKDAYSLVERVFVEKFGYIPNVEIDEKESPMKTTKHERNKNPGLGRGND